MFDPNEVFPDECDLCNFEDYWEEGGYTVIEYAERPVIPDEVAIEILKDGYRCERILFDEVAGNYLHHWEERDHE